MSKVKDLISESNITKKDKSSTKGFLKTISMKDGVSRLSIRANGFKELNVDMVSMIPPTRMTLQIRNQQVKVSNTKECGRMIPSMVLVLKT